MGDLRFIVHFALAAVESPRVHARIPAALRPFRGNPVQGSGKPRAADGIGEVDDPLAAAARVVAEIARESPLIAADLVGADGDVAAALGCPEVDEV